ncbi:hypothetical protein [Paramaledivibacter caminithermalis]|jgi:hypothetical protein|uniref:Uncharacterized protein n=1 Tax=Paramaledivibacter caminithermalis (strain DSM 15212 / CIP 107654 / DViRD3) TaxID=1121301 RepID=A0A1M6SUD3_PARC5|nr:hypothetical protein [Paramaledivibacter caminithermalis]SHK48178.1 hypothetical protein SAMN02745912_03435 [Paramaledivibacter caminithermalis DSM 15212]
MNKKNIQLYTNQKTKSVNYLKEAITFSTSNTSMDFLSQFPTFSLNYWGEGPHRDEFVFTTDIL